MQQLLYLLPVLACPVGMGAMMWLMMRGKGRNQDAGPANAGSPHSQFPSPDTANEIASLRAQIDQLEAAQHDAARGATPKGTTR